MDSLHQPRSDIG